MAKSVRVPGIPALLRQLPDFPAYYASKDGHIYRLAKIDHFEPKKIPKPLKPQVNPQNGYLKVNLYRGGRVARTRYVHKLVASVWLKPKPGAQVHHKNLDKSDCSVANLTYLLPLTHRRRHSKLLAAQQVRAIRNSTLTVKQLSAKYGRAKTPIALIKSNRNYKWVA